MKQTELRALEMISDGCFSELRSCFSSASSSLTRPSRSPFVAGFSPEGRKREPASTPAAKIKLVAANASAVRRQTEMLEIFISSLDCPGSPKAADSRASGNSYPYKVLVCTVHHEMPT